VETVTSGAVAERLKATVLKTVVPKGTGGSNPSCSVSIRHFTAHELFGWLFCHPA
jgi:hypothetical protein